MKFAVCVALEIRPEMKEEFKAHIYSNAEASLERERGCIQFDVCTDDGLPNEVFLYEVYTSPDAFDLHLQSEHFKTFNEATASMVKNKHVKTYRVIS